MIVGFRSVLCVSVFQGSLLLIVIMIDGQRKTQLRGRLLNFRVRMFVKSAVSKCLAVAPTAAPIFLFKGATRHFVWLSCEICAEIVVYRMLAFFLNGLNGKNSSRSIVRNIFSVYFFYSGFKISYSEYSFVTQIVISVIRIVSYISERHVLYIYLTCE